MAHTIAPLKGKVAISRRRRRSMRIAIVGGGIGSMTLALSLLDAGIDDVDIYESASAVKELGVGINVLPHAVRELTDLGLLEALYRPMSKRYKDQGRALINWVAECKTADDQPMPQQDWEHTTRLEEVLKPFAAFHFDCLDVPAMIRGAEVIYHYPMVDRDPLPTWDFGRITLLGDAAHPMHPAGSNGASPAILDARVLARELALQPSIEAAVAGYDALRRPATALVVQANHQGGPGAMHGDRRATSPRGVRKPRRHRQPAGVGGDRPCLQAHRRIRSRDAQPPALAIGALSVQHERLMSVDCGLTSGWSGPADDQRTTVERCVRPAAQPPVMSLRRRADRSAWVETKATGRAATES